MAGFVSAREGGGKRGVVSSPSAHNRDTSPLGPSTNTLTLNRQGSTSGRKPRNAAHLLHGSLSSRDISPSKHSTGLTALLGGLVFTTNITFGTQTFSTIVDTGSSDTWVIRENFQCVHIKTAEKLPTEDCYFGPAYTKESTFDQIPGETFNITYGDGTFAGGVMGYEDVTLGGIKVRQEVALVDYSAWRGDGITSGLTGLAYPSM